MPLAAGIRIFPRPRMRRLASGWRGNGRGKTLWRRLCARTWSVQPVSTTFGGACEVKAVQDWRPKAASYSRQAKLNRLVRGIGTLPLRYRRPFSSAGTHDGIGNLLQIGGGQFERCGPDPAVDCWGERPPTMAPVTPGEASTQAIAPADTVVR
jgi:hypothetical protein